MKTKNRRRYGLVISFVLLAAFILVSGAYRASAGDAKWKAQYYNNRTLSGSSVLTRDEEAINYDWGDGSPDSRVDVDDFSARWTRTIYFGTPGTYRFTATMDDGMRVWLDDTLIIDSWTDSQVHSLSSDVFLSAGDHTLKVEYYEAGGKAVAKFSWALTQAPPPEPIARWRGVYYNNQYLSGAPALVRDDNEINFDWQLGSPWPTIPNDRFSVRWTRNLTLNPGRYRFSTTVDDGVRLWVNGVLIIDQWHDNQDVTYTADTLVAGGLVPVVMEYYENGGAALAKLSYEWLGSGPILIVTPGATPQPTPTSPAGIVTPPDGPFGVVAAQLLNVRAAPEFGDNVTTAVSRGTVLELIGRNGGWLKARLPNGVEGWVGSSYIVTKYPIINLPILDA